MTPGVLMVPGYTGSGPGHWQSLWQATHPAWRRVEQRDWAQPEIIAWRRALHRAVEEAEGPLVLAAHSLGCILVAHAASELAPRVRGALLVAPSDVDAAAFPYPAVGFAPIPAAPLPFPSVLVASGDDALLTPARAAALAKAWGSRLVTVSDGGHLNTASGYGPWPQGLALLAALLEEAVGPPAPG